MWTDASSFISCPRTAALWSKQHVRRLVSSLACRSDACQNHSELWQTERGNPNWKRFPFVTEASVHLHSIYSMIIIHRTSRRWVKQPMALHGVNEPTTKSTTFMHGTLSPIDALQFRLRNFSVAVDNRKHFGVALLYIAQLHIPRAHVNCTDCSGFNAHCGCAFSQWVVRVSVPSTNNNNSQMGNWKVWCCVARAKTRGKLCAHVVRCLYLYRLQMPIFISECVCVCTMVRALQSCRHRRRHCHRRNCKCESNKIIGICTFQRDSECSAIINLRGKKVLKTIRTYNTTINNNLRCVRNSEKQKHWHVVMRENTQKYNNVCRNVCAPSGLQYYTHAPLTHTYWHRLWSMRCTNEI